MTEDNEWKLVRRPMGKIAEALAAFQADLPHVGKDKRADVGQYTYSYADLEDITNAAMPVLSKHGLSFVALPRRTDAGYEVAGVLLHTSGERLEGSLPLHGNQPQQVGSALTYMRRYLLCSMTGIVAGSDDDGRAANDAPRTEPLMQAKTRGRMFALFAQKFGEKGKDPEFQLNGINSLTGASYTSRSQITDAHGKQVITDLETRPDAPKSEPTEEPS